MKKSVNKNKLDIKKSGKRNLKIIIYVVGAFSGSIGLQWSIIEIIKEFVSRDYFLNKTVPIPYAIVLHSIIIALITYLIYYILEDRKSDLQLAEDSVQSYKNQRDAEQDIITDINQSQEINIFTIRGHSFILPERSFGFLPNQINKKVKYCIADPKTKKKPNKYIIERALEYENVTVESYWNDLNNDIIKIKEILKRNPNFQCKLHSYPAFFRLFIFDAHVYFSFFKPFVSGSKLILYRANKNSELYSGFKRFFDKVWDESVPLIKD